jgi:hypothetical protein
MWGFLALRTARRILADASAGSWILGMVISLSLDKQLVRSHQDRRAKYARKHS